MVIGKRIGAGLVVAAAMLVSGGCVTTGGGAGGGDSSVITADELADVEARNLYEAVRQLRPLWLRTRVRQFTSGVQESPIVVYRGNARLGGVEQLHDLGLDAAEWLSWMDGPRASASLPGLGSEIVEGAIVIHTQPPEEQGDL